MPLNTEKGPPWLDTGRSRRILLNLSSSRPNLGRSRQFQTGFDRSRHVAVDFGRYWQISVDFGRYWQISADSGRFRQIPTKYRQISRKSWQIPTDCDGLRLLGEGTEAYKISEILGFKVLLLHSIFVWVQYMNIKLYIINAFLHNLGIISPENGPYLTQIWNVGMSLLEKDILTFKALKKVNYIHNS